MKALVIADPSCTEILYFWLDDEFKHQLSNIAGGTYSDPGSLIQSHFFPLIVCYENLKSQFDERCSVIECEDDKSTVLFQQHSQWLYIGIYDGQFMYKKKLCREMLFLCTSIGFLFGPCGHYQFKTPSVDHKQKVWEKVTCLIESYVQLCSSESTFLLEAIEKMRVSDDVLEPCAALIKKESLASKDIVSVMIFVGTKLLFLHTGTGNARDLSTSNVLQILTLIHSSFSKPNITTSSCSSNHDEEDGQVSNNNSNNIPGTGSSYRNILLDDDTAFLHTDLDFLYDNTVYFSDAAACATTEMQQPFSSPNSSVFDSTVDSIDGNELSENDETDSNCLIIDEDHFSSVGMSKQTEPVIQEDCYRVPLYLSNTKRPFVPHVLDCIPVFSEVKMVLISQVKHAIVSDVICAMLYWLKWLESLDGIHKTEALRKLQKCRNKLCSLTNKINGEVKQMVKIIAKDVANLQQKSNADVHSMNNWICEIEKQLHNLFKILFPSCVDKSTVTSALNLSKIQLDAIKQLSEYKGYLSVRAQHNITITSYLNKFSGMVHFAFLRRFHHGPFSAIPSFKVGTFQDEVFMTSMVVLNSGINANSAASLSSSLKEELWNTLYLNSQSIDNNKSITTRVAKGLTFTLYTWYGKKFQPLPSYENQHKSSIKLNKYESSSIFSGNLHRKRISSANADSYDYSCLYQIICVHFSVVPHEVIMAQLKELYTLKKLFFDNVDDE